MKTPGMLAKLIGIVGLVLAIKVIMLITSKTSERLFEWWGTRPLMFFRIVALVFLTMGAMLLFV